jgi:hypothetical protein
MADFVHKQISSGEVLEFSFFDCLSAPPNVLHFIQFLGVGYYMVGVMSRGFQIVFWKMSKWGGAFYVKFKNTKFCILYNIII